eukprot:768668-Hanusia_phi.AAC.8
MTQLDRVEGRTLHLSGVDIIQVGTESSTPAEVQQGTPILDVKPYIPDYDNETGEEVKMPEVYSSSPSSPPLASSPYLAPTYPASALLPPPPPASLLVRMSVSLVSHPCPPVDQEAAGSEAERQVLA